MTARNQFQRDRKQRRCIPICLAVEYLFTYGQHTVAEPDPASRLAPCPVPWPLVCFGSWAQPGASTVRLASGADRVSGPGGVHQGGVFGWRAVALALPSGPRAAAVRPNSCRQGLVPATVRCGTGAVGAGLGAVASCLRPPRGCDSGSPGPFVVPGHCGRRPVSILPGTDGRSVGHPFRAGSEVYFRERV